MPSYFNAKNIDTCTLPHLYRCYSRENISRLTNTSTSSYYKAVHFEKKICILRCKGLQ